MPGTLFVVGTPIGNLEDITQRALRILGDVDLVVAEDTRHTKKLLTHFGLHKALLSFHKFSSDQAIEKIFNELQQGKNIAYVVDAGTPGISDPGSYLVNKLLERGIQVTPIPGVSAVSTLLSIAGINTNEFLFVGFLPRKKGRNTMLEQIKNAPYPVVFFESPHRIIKTMQDFAALGEFHLVIGRELTKQFETIYRGTIPEILPQVEQQPKGEFTIIITPVT